jgi:hypothetical protein
LSRQKQEKKQEVKLYDQESSSMSMMRQLANNDIDMPVDIDGERLIDRSKLFLVAQARNDLTRIIKLTNFLEKLEDKFIDAVNNALEDDPNSILLISSAMDTISRCLADANEHVMQIMKDDKLQQVIINTTNIITPDGNSTTIIDADSRDSVRNLAASLLAQLSSMSDEEATDAVVVEEEQPSENGGE